MSDTALTWTFPLRGRGIVFLLGGLALVVAAVLLASASIPLVPAGLTTVAAIYLCSVSYFAVRDTARGENTMASWPGLPVTEAFFVPVARTVAGVLWSCLPAFLYRVLAGHADILFWVLFLLGVYLIPMVVVRVATRESFLAGHPVATLISILRTLRDYTTTCVPYYVAVLLATFAATVFTEWQAWGLVATSHGFAIYLYLTELYALGLFHRRNARRLHLRGLLEPPPEETPEAAPAGTASPAAGSVRPAPDAAAPPEPEPGT